MKVLNRTKKPGFRLKAASIRELFYLAAAFNHGSDLNFCAQPIRKV